VNRFYLILYNFYNFCVSINEKKPNQKILIAYLWGGGTVNQLFLIRWAKKLRFYPIGRYVELSGGRVSFQSIQNGSFYGPDPGLVKK
jgi:hypothetical protein